MSVIRSLKSLVHDAVDATVDLIREGHESTARNVFRATDAVPGLRTPGRAVDVIRRVSTDGVLGSIKLVNRGVEVLTDAGFDAGTTLKGSQAAVSEPRPAPAIPLHSRPEGKAQLLGDAALGLLNGAVGDYLHRQGSALDLSMRLRVGDVYVEPEGPALAEALPNATPRVAIFVHGLATTEWSWCLEAESRFGDPEANFGTLLARDLGFTPLFVRYNTGREIADNAILFAELLERLAASYPVPIDDLTIVGHSMGGLITRGACAHGEARGLSWVERVTRVFYLGSPHTGAPFARFGQGAADIFGAIDLPGTQILARIIEGRSAGVQDLSAGHASILDPERGRLPLPHASHHFVASTLTEDPDHPVGRFFGDLLVRVPSAQGGAERRAFPVVQRSHHGGVWHHQLQTHPAVYEEILRACAAGR